jgi:hypothetical protein
VKEERRGRINVVVLHEKRDSHCPKKDGGVEIVGD